MMMTDFNDNHHYHHRYHHRIVVVVIVIMLKDALIFFLVTIYSLLRALFPTRTRQLNSRVQTMCKISDANHVHQIVCHVERKKNISSELLLDGYVTSK